jgi:hypothetical protein
MLQVFWEKQWKTFHPLSSVIYGEEFDYRPLEELPNKVYGKLIGGVAGYQPWWVYGTFDKKDIREEPKKK